MLFDSHAHLDVHEFDEDRDELLERLVTEASSTEEPYTTSVLATSPQERHSRQSRSEVSSMVARNSGVLI